MAKRNKDERYDRVFLDPKFWSVPRSEKRLKIDKRFERMFSDERFCARSAPVDRRGRPNELVQWADKSKSKIAGKNKSDLEKFYEISEDTVNDRTDESNADNTEEVTEEQEIELRKKAKKKKETQRNCETGSQKPKKAKRKKGSETPEETTEPTSRLAICNQDWDRIRAIDLLMLFRSFLSAETDCSPIAVKRITIYQSAYGAKRQAIDDAKGPAELRKAAQKAGEEDEETMREGLAKYQRNRLRYCYAVVECDSQSSAHYFYQQLDGMEFEDSCTRLDLRFIPDSTSFDDCKVMSAADTQQAMNSRYEPPPSFVTTALGQTAVKLTWEEEQTPQRKRALQALLEVGSDQDDDSLPGDLVAPPSDEEASVEENEKIADALIADDSSESGDEEKFQRYRSLLLAGSVADEKAPSEDVPHMEVTWDPGLAGSNKFTENKDIDSGNESDSETVKFAKKSGNKGQKRKTKPPPPAQDKDDVQAFKMMFGTSDGDSKRKTDFVEGANDPRFADMLKRPEFHRDVDHAETKKLKRKCKTAGKKDNRRQHSHFH